MEAILKVVSRLALIALAIGALGAPISLRGVDYSKHIHVKGFGFLGSRYLKQLLSILDIAEDEAHNPAIDSYYIEDAISVLKEELKAQGYETPAFEIRLTASDGSLQGFQFQDKFEPELPLDLMGKKLTIRVIPGLLTHYKSVSIKGVPHHKPHELANYFYATDAFIIPKKSRPFTQSQLKKSIKTLLKDLREEGYLEAVTDAPIIHKNEKTRGVSVEVVVNLGQRYYIDKLTVEACQDKDTPASCEIVETQAYNHQQVYSERWRGDQLYRIRKQYFKQGYPNVEVTSKVDKKALDGSMLGAGSQGVGSVSTQASAYTNEKVYIGNIGWTNAGRTRPSVLMTKKSPKPGDLLNPLAIEDERDRLLGIGIFENVDIVYDKQSEALWNVGYNMQQRKKLTLEALTGWGSYEQLRLGFVLNRNNVAGLGHSDNVRVIKSKKSTQAKYNYSIPDFLNQRGLTAFVRAKALARQELSFRRKEASAAVGVESFLRNYKASCTLQFNYELLRAKNLQNKAEPADRSYKVKARVSSLELEIIKSRVDNPVFPQKGYRFVGGVESAYSFLGGNTDFHKLEGRFSFHHPLTHLLICHGNVGHGLIVTPKATKDKLPLNRRFLLGGQNTVRGFREGQASPRDASGDLIGSETYLLFNFELEQKLLSKISLIEFWDIAWIGEKLKRYPGNQALSSIGVGMLIATVIGPIRFEYGHNVKKRSTDPQGTFHFSVGAAF